MRIAHAFIALAFVLLTPALAYAGGCPVCTTAMDCSSPAFPCTETEPCFCVLHDGDVGCGAMRQICCPGQACAVNAGRPSCEGMSCTVVDGPFPAGDAGAGATDAGPGGADSGPGGADSGPPAGTDGGATGSDAGGAGQDGGGPGGVDAGPDGSDDGCGCRAVGATRAPPLSLLLIALGLALLRRRAR